MIPRCISCGSFLFNGSTCPECEAVAMPFTSANLRPPAPPSSSPKEYGPVLRVGPDFTELLREVPE